LGFFGFMSVSPRGYIEEGDRQLCLGELIWFLAAGWGGRVLACSGELGGLEI
jgi:hypothetical protein